MKRTWIAVGVWVVLCSVLLAQAPAAKNMIGTWKLNPAKSTFSPGPALKSQTAKLDPWTAE